MAESVTTKLKALRTRAGLSMGQIAKRLGLKAASSYQRYEDPALFTKDSLPVPMVRKLLDVLPGLGSPPIAQEEVLMLAGIEGLTVPQLRSLDEQDWVWCVGEVAAGIWREAFEWDREEWKPILMGVRDARYPKARRTALLVRGDSMDELYPDGSYVIFVRFDEIATRPRPGNKIVLLRHRQGLVEATIKIFSKDAGGKSWLVPKSSNPKYTAIALDEPDEGVSAEVMGLVVGSHRLE